MNNFLKKLNLIIDPSYNVDFLLRNNFDDLLTFMTEGLNYRTYLLENDTNDYNNKTVSKKINTSNAINFIQILPDDFKVVFFLLLGSIIAKTNRESMTSFADTYLKIEHPDRDIFIMKFRNIKNNIHSDIHINYPLEVKLLLEQARIKLK